MNTTPIINEHMTPIINEHMTLIINVVLNSYWIIIMDHVFAVLIVIQIVLTTLYLEVMTVTYNFGTGVN